MKCDRKGVEMAKNNETTTKFKVDISDLVKGMQTAKRQISLANAEFKAATAGMDNWSKSADGVSAKLSQLDKTLKSQNDILDNLEEQYRLTAEQMGKDSKEAENLKIKIENQKASIAKTEKQITQYTKALSDIKSESNASESAIDKLSNTINKQENELSDLKKAYSNTVLQYGKNSKEAKTLANQIDSLSSELADNKKEIDKANKSADKLDKSLDDLGDSAKGAESGFTVLKGAVATFAGNMATKMVGGIKSGVSYLANLADNTREFRQDLATLNTAFTDVGFSADQAKGVWKDLYGVFGEDDRAVEAANNISRMAKSQQELDEWVRITTGIWGTYQDALPVEGLAEAAGETAKTGTVTGVLADALNWSSEAASMFADYMSDDVTTAEDAFNEALKGCTNEQERQALITETLTSLYGKAGDTYNETAKNIIDANKATADLATAQASMADKIEPIVAVVKQGFADILNKVLELVDGVDFEAFAADMQAGFQTFIDDTLPKIIDGLGWLIDNKDTIIAGIAGMGAAFAAWKVVTLIQGVVGAIKAFQLANEGATVAQWALNVAMNANPIGLIIAAIVGLVAAFVVLWKKSEAFREFWIGLWNGIVSIVSTVVTAIGEFFSGLWDNIKTIWSTVSTWFNDNIIQPLIGFFSGLWSTVSGFFSQLWADIVNIFVGAATWFNDTVVQPIVNFFSQFWSNIVAIFSPAIEWFSALFTSIWNTLSSIVNIIIGLLQGCWAMICRVFEVAGDWFNTNVIQPVANFFKDLWDKISNGAKAAWDFVSGVFKKVASWFNDNVIQPVIKFFKDLWDKISSGAQAAWDKVSGIFEKVSGWFNDNVIKPVAEFFSGMWDKLKSGASDAWDGIKSVFSSVASFFGDVFGSAWSTVKDIFSTGGQIFDGIKEGIVDAFTTIVNAIIRGINKVVEIPFNAINNALDIIRNISFLGISPFKGLFGDISVPQIPELAGGIGKAEKGKQYLLEGNGDEMVLPLAKDSKWLDEVASRIVAKGGTVNNQPQTVNNTYNYELNQTNNSPKALSRLEIYRQTKNQIAFAKGV